MGTFNRRTALSGSLSVAALAALAACSGGRQAGGPGSGGSSGAVQWWDAGQPTTQLDKDIAKKYASELGDVVVTYQENTKIGQALQLAHQSNQMPDVTQIGGLGVPIAELVAQGWFQPLQLDDAATKRVESMGLIPGIHVFDGKTYTFPVNISDINTVNWFHLDALTQAGLDPQNPPTNYDDFRSACQQVVKGGKMQGLLLPLKVTGANSSRIETLAQAAGWAGNGGQLFATGEYNYHGDEWVNALEFLMSLTKDKLMFAGNLNSTIKDGQVRWAGNATAFYFDGPWIPGNIKLNYPQLKDAVAGGPTLVPEKGMQPAAYTPPPGGAYYVPAGIKHADKANKIMSILAGAEYEKMLAGIMGHLPLDPSSVDSSDAYPIYKALAKLLYPTIFRAPSAVAGNPAVTEALAVVKAVTPDAGTVIQGYFSGDVTDIRKALKQVSDASQKALDDAIAAAKKKGAKVSLDDWVFGNWKPRADYTADMYKQR